MERDCSKRSEPFFMGEGGEYKRVETNKRARFAKENCMLSSVILMVYLVDCNKSMQSTFISQ